DNAKGITNSVKNRFDDRKVLTRALNAVLADDTRLVGLVDLQSDRIAANSRYLVGAKHVADIMRSLVVGTGRIGKRVEAELSEATMVKEFNSFLHSMLTAFPELRSVFDGHQTPGELRRKSLLGSNVML